MNLLQIDDLHVDFNVGGHTMAAVRGVSLGVAAGETTALVGESGSGKSSTAMAVLRLNPEPPAQYPKGRILFQGTDLLGLESRELRAIRGRQIAMIFQDPMATLNPLVPVGAQVAEVLRIHRLAEPGAHRSRVLEALTQAGIPEPERRAAQYPHQLSGGLRQRVMIAMALVGRPELLIADEPTTALDVTVQAEILDLLRRLQRENGMGILLITHDLGVVASLADRVAVMRSGELVEEGDVLQVFEGPRHEYTRTLLRVTPTLAAAGHARAGGGDV